MAADLLLIVVAYHPTPAEVHTLVRCLSGLSPTFHVVVIANDHQPGEPVDLLLPQANLFITSRCNLGYARAFHEALSAYAAQAPLPAWVGVLNTDLSWQPGSFERMLGWLHQEPDVVLAVPRIVDPSGQLQQLCKRDPTLLSLASRRFIPQWLKPRWLRRYDSYHLMEDKSLDRVFDVPYLSGCCMLIKRAALDASGGFDQRFFLYLEDADISRTLRHYGRCVHLPFATITHAWGRGNHRSLWLTLVNFHSAWIYFCKWGWRCI